MDSVHGIVRLSNLLKAIAVSIDARLCFDDARLHMQFTYLYRPSTSRGVFPWYRLKFRLKLDACLNPSFSWTDRTDLAFLSMTAASLSLSSISHCSGVMAWSALNHRCKVLTVMLQRLASFL